MRFIFIVLLIVFCFPSPVMSIDLAGGSEADPYVEDGGDRKDSSDAARSCRRDYGPRFFPVKYGPDAFYCAEVSGHVRVDSYLDDAVHTARNDNPFSSFVQLNVSLDGRFGKTSYGDLRVYSSVNLDAPDPTTTNKDPGRVYVRRAFIQLGGATIGRAASVWNVFTGFLPNFKYTKEFYGADLNLASYRLQLTRRWSFTGALEDFTTCRAGSSDNPLKLPDVVANFNFNTGWFKGQVMGVLHATSKDLDNIGWGLGAGFESSQFLLAGVKLGAQVAYTEGAVLHASSSLNGPITDFTGDKASSTLAIQTGLGWDISRVLSGALGWSYARYSPPEAADGADDSSFYRHSFGLAFSRLMANTLKVTLGSEYRMGGPVAASGNEPGTIFGFDNEFVLVGVRAVGTF